MNFDQVKEILSYLYHEQGFKDKIPEQPLKIAISSISKKTDRGSITRAINSMCDLDIIQYRHGVIYLSEQGYKLLGVEKNAE